MTKLLATDLTHELKIRPDQKAELIAQCEELNKELQETMVELERQTKLYRQEIRNMYAEVLTEKQYKHLEIYQGENLPMLFQDIYKLFMDTDLNH